MAVVDDLIVAMKFDNKQFEAAVKISIATLGALKNNLDFGKKAGGFDQVSNQASENASALSRLADSAEGVGQKFTIMGAIGFSAVQKITNSVMDVGTSLVRSGLSNGLGRALKIEQAKFQFKGLGQDVKASMASALGGVKDTAYGLDAAASVAAQFGATGMKAGDEMTGALRGVAGMSAMTGKSFEEIGGIFTTVAGEGKLSTMRMQQFATRGVNVAAKLAEQMGKTEVEIRSMVTKGEISFQDFASAMNDAFGEHATAAADTYSGALANMEAATSRIGASFHIPRLEAMRKIFNALTPIIDDIGDGLAPLVDEFTRFTEIKGDKLVAWIEKIDLSKMANVVKPLAKGFFNIVDSIGSVFGVMGNAFREVFDKAPAIQYMADRFENFTFRLKMGGETAEKLKRTFKGVFAVFSIAGQIIGGVIKVIAGLFMSLSKGSGGFLNITASVGDWLVAIDRALKDGELLSKFFSGLGSILKLPIMAFGLLFSAVGKLFGAFNKLGPAIGTVYGILAKGDFKGGIWEEDSTIVAVLFRIRDALVVVGSVMNQFWNIMAKGDFVGGYFEEDSAFVQGLFNFRDKIKEFFTAGNIAKMLGVGAAAALALGFKGIVDKALGIFSGESDGMFKTLKDTFSSIKGSFDGVSGMFDKLTSSLTVMQNDIKANMLLKIAVAVGVLALALALLASIDAGDLAKALGGMTIAFTQLLAAMAVLGKISGSAGFVKMPMIAVGLAALAVSVLILAAAVKVFSSMSWDEMLRGLVGVGVALGLLVAAAYGLAKAEGPMLRAGLAMIPLAIGIRILATAVKAMSGMEWHELFRGLGGVAGAMIVLAAGVRLMPKNMVATGAGIILVAAGLKIMVKSIQALGQMDGEALKQGLIGVGAALLIIAAAMHLMPKNLPIIAVGLIVVAGALAGITSVVETLGGMELGDMVQGLIGLGVALGLLSISLLLMQGAIGGAIALGIAAVGLTMLLGPLLIMATMPWESLLQGLVGLAAVLVILGVAGYTLGPIVPVLLGIGAAMTLMGIGMLAVGVGAFALAAAFTMFIVALNKSQDAIMILIDFIPRLVEAIVSGLVQFVQTIASNAVKIGKAFQDIGIAMLDAIIAIVPKILETAGAILSGLLRLIIEKTPEIAEAFKTIVLSFLDVLTTIAPQIYDSIFQIMIGFLKVIRDRVPEVVEVVTDIIVAFIGALAQNLPRIVQAGFDFIITFINGLADAVEQNTGPILDAVARLGKAIIDGLVQGIGKGIELVANAARDLAKKALSAAMDFLGINSPSREFIKVGEGIGEGLVIGINESQKPVSKAANQLATGVVAGFSKGMGKEMPKAIDAIFESLESGITDTKFWGNNTAISDQFTHLSGEVWQAELALASFYGEVDMADPSSIEAYMEKAGGKLIYLAGLFDGLREAANTAFGMLADGKGLDAVLGDEDFLSQILRSVTSLLPGIEGAAIMLGFGIVDGLLSVFLGPGTTVLGTIGKWITKLVKAVGGWFGIKFPIAEELDESEKALEDFMVRVDDGHGRFEKLTEEAVKGLTDTLTNADALLEGIEGTNPVVTPVLDLKQWDSDIDKFLDSLNTGPVILNAVIDRVSDFVGAVGRNIDAFFNPRKAAASNNTTVEFTQNNNSPKALDHVEIYRQTKGQLSLAKEELSIS